MNEFLHAEKIAPTDTHRYLLNVYGDQPVGVSTATGGWCVSVVVTTTVKKKKQSPKLAGLILFSRLMKARYKRGRIPDPFENTGC